VSELTAVLAETQSPDTYVATLVVLATLGAESRPALPAAIRHGERLGVFRGAFRRQDKNAAEGLQEVFQYLALIANGGKAEVPVYHWQRPAGPTTQQPQEPVTPGGPSGLTPAVGYPLPGAGPGASPVPPADASPPRSQAAQPSR
jgi:hypothetical protein